MADAAGPAARIPAFQLQLANEQLQRSPWVVVAIDLFVAWLLVRAGASPLWYALVPLTIGLQFARSRDVRRMAALGTDPSPADLRRITSWFFVIGLARALPVVQGFVMADRDLQFLLTMVTIGTAAGGIGSAAGMHRAYGAWTLPLALALVGGWFSHADVEGGWIAFLLVLMFWLMNAMVRNYGATLQQLGREIDRANAERERAEQERRRADEERQRAETAVLAKSRFFAAASHDLRQPLGVLRWYGDAVRLHADRLNHEPLQAIGDGIARALEHAEPLVRKYLDIARIEAGALQLTPAAVALAPLFKQVCEGFARDADERGMHLAITLDPGVPAAALVVDTDAGVLRSILDNLVGNALKFTPDGGRIDLQARAVRHGDGSGPAAVRIAISDTGIGIAADEQARVFEDFYQLANPERSRSKGLGLGLGIVRRQAALLGTSVHLHSRPGQGTTFEFELPAARRGAEAPAPAPSGDVRRAAGDGPVRVLAIDDEPDARHSLCMMLEAVHWQARCAADLDEARALLAEGFVPDILVVDFRLRGALTGLDAVQALRAGGLVVPALVVTGDTSPEQLRRLAEAGLPVLHKPVAGEHLVATIVDQLMQGGRT